MYSWQSDYIAALIEVESPIIDCTKQFLQRLLAPLEPGSPEELALRQAQRVIAVLRERPS